MDNSSFSISRRKLLAAGGLFLTSCGYNAVTAPEEAAKIIPVCRRQTAYQVFSYLASQALSPLEALDALTVRYQADKQSGGYFVASIAGEEGFWIYLVDNLIPDTSGMSTLMRLGKVVTASADDAQRELANFSRGQFGSSLSLVNNRLWPSSTTTFRPSGGLLFVRITWMRVGPLRLDV